MFAVQVPCGTQMISRFDLALVSRDWKKLKLNFCRLSNGLFLNLGVTCFCSEWQDRANRPQLPKAQDCEWATFPVALLRASPSSQPPSLPKFIPGISLPTSVSTTVYCQMIAFWLQIWHYICTLDFKAHFKLVVFLGIRTETSWTVTGTVPRSRRVADLNTRSRLTITVARQWAGMVTVTVTRPRPRARGCRAGS